MAALRTTAHRSRPRGSATGFAIATLALVLGCQARPDGSTCPHGSARETARRDRLLERLATEPLTSTIVTATEGRFVVCWAAGIESGVDAQHRLRLDARLDDDRAAAKLGHLLLHVSEGLPWDEDDPRPCGARLSTAREREVRGHGLESALLRSFGQPPLDAAAVERVMAAYRARCPGATAPQPSAGASSK